MSKPIAPRADFEDGYRVAEVIETIARSAESGRFEYVNYRQRASKKVSFERTK